MKKIHAIRSWSPKNFAKQYGMDEAKRVLSFRSRQSVYNLYDRDVKIVEMSNGQYEVWESKLLTVSKVRKMNLHSEECR